jgi:hypothetical protein
MAFILGLQNTHCFMTCNNTSNILCDVVKTDKQLYVKNDNKYAGFKLVHCND